MKIIVRKFKDNNVAPYKKWAGVLMDEKLNEAKLSLAEEQIDEEAAAVVKINGEDYLIGVIASQGQPLPANSKSELNIQHQKANKEYLGENIDVEILYDIKAE
jgi:hypothetical protein